METVSHSEVEAWLLCERRHYYGYSLGLQRIEESESLRRGNLGHEVMEHYYNKLLHPDTVEISPVKDTLKYLMFRMDGTNSKIVDEVAKFFGWHMQINPFANDRILAVEKEFVVQLPGVDFGIALVIDLIIQRPDRSVIIVDHKFSYDFYTNRTVRLMPQVPKYLWAAQALGKPADAGAYNLFRTRTMKAPTPADKNQVFQFTPTPERIERTITEHVTAGKQIQERKALPLEVQSQLATRVANTMICKSCSFNSLCSAELDGPDANPNLVAKSEYKLRERRHFGEDEEA